MINRIDTRRIKIGNIYIGGSDHVIIQSMCNIKTEKVDEIVAQINQCAKAGAEIMRVSILDQKDAKAIKEIVKRISIPLVADIHFDYKLALASIDSGVNAIRINPGNIGDMSKIKEVVDACKAKSIPIRVGVNSGSLDKTIYDGNDKIKAQFLVDSAKKHVKILEDLGFFDIVVSLKGSTVKETIEAYTLAAETFPYPLHLGITEAGPSEVGIIRSVAGLAPLLIAGIGSTIRISLSDDPIKEVESCKRLLHDLGMYPNYPTLISCPTCGRTQVELTPLAKKVLTYLEENNKYITVAVMGCIVNGPGEAKHADIGLAGGKGEWVLFKKGQVLRRIKQEDAFTELVKEIESL